MPKDSSVKETGQVLAKSLFPQTMLDKYLVSSKENFKKKKNLILSAF